MAESDVELGQWLRARREELGIRDVDLCEAAWEHLSVPLHEVALRAIETGSRHPSVWHLDVLSYLLGLTDDQWDWFVRRWALHPKRSGVTPDKLRKIAALDPTDALVRAIGSVADQLDAAKSVVARVQAAEVALDVPEVLLFAEGLEDFDALRNVVNVARDWMSHQIPVARLLPKGTRTRMSTRRRDPNAIALETQLKLRTTPEEDALLRLTMGTCGADSVSDLVRTMIVDALDRDEVQLNVVEDGSSRTVSHNVRIRLTVRQLSELRRRLRGLKIARWAHLVVFEAIQSGRALSVYGRASAAVV